jgi:hypothetical protein
MDKQFKYKSLQEFKKENPTEYGFLFRKNLINKLCQDMNWLNNKFIPWTFERCLEIALKYKTKADWVKHNSRSYNASRKHGWLAECTTHMTQLQKPSGFWKKKENCIKEALKYNNRQEWTKNNVTSYINAKKKGWLEECTAHMFESRKLPNYWTKEKCIEEALKYKTISEWQKLSTSSYNATKKNNWMDECTKHMVKKLNRKKDWDFESCKKDALEYQTKKAWIINSNSAYSWAIRNKVYDECTQHMVSLQKPSGYWTFERCLEEALKYKTKIDWIKHNSSSYNASRKHGWVEVCIAHMGYENFTPTIEECLEDSKKYCGVRDWIKHNRKMYNFAKKNKLLEECKNNYNYNYSNKKPNGYWDREHCLVEALKYTTKSDWAKNGKSSYGIAIKNSWFEECTSHMKKK